MKKDNSRKINFSGYAKRVYEWNQPVGKEIALASLDESLNSLARQLNNVTDLNEIASRLFDVIGDCFFHSVRAIQNGSDSDFDVAYNRLYWYGVDVQSLSHEDRIEVLKTLVSACKYVVSRFKRPPLALLCSMCWALGLDIHSLLDANIQKYKKELLP